MNRRCASFLCCLLHLAIVRCPSSVSFKLAFHCIWPLCMRKAKCLYFIIQAFELLHEENLSIYCFWRDSWWTSYAKFDQRESPWSPHHILESSVNKTKRTKNWLWTPGIYLFRWKKKKKIKRNLNFNERKRKLKVSFQAHSKSTCSCGNWNRFCPFISYLLC